MEVTFTNWDKECDLLIEYLNFKIEHGYNNQVRILCGTCIMVEPRLSAKEFFDLYQSTGLLIYNSTEESDYEELTFEKWKINFNKNKFAN